MDASIGQACEGQARAFKDQVINLIKLKIKLKLKIKIILKIHLRSMLDRLLLQNWILTLREEELFRLSQRQNLRLSLSVQENISMNSSLLKRQNLFENCLIWVTLKASSKKLMNSSWKKIQVIS